MAAARAYRADRKQNGDAFVDAINASTDHDHRSLAQISAVTGFGQHELDAILGA
jgi:hypothetical protein